LGKVEEAVGKNIWRKKKVPSLQRCSLASKQQPPKELPIARHDPVAYFNAPYERRKREHPGKPSVTDQGKDT
jgi:hypothetical protein